MITAYAILKKGAANPNYAGKRLDQRHKLGSGYEGMFADDLNGQTFLPGQANNFYIFPAVGMAIFAAQAKRVTDEMFIQAGQAVADQVPSELLKQGLLYPLQPNILETEIQTAARVAKPVSTPARPGSRVQLTWSRLSATSLCTNRNTATKHCGQVRRRRAVLQTQRNELTRYLSETARLFPHGFSLSILCVLAQIF